MKGTEEKTIFPLSIPEHADENMVFQQLWNELVPPSGKAESAQGEIIRIAGRVEYEFLDNGTINWDEDFDKMLDTFLDYVQLGIGFQGEELADAERLVRTLQRAGQKGKIIDSLLKVLRSCALNWVRQNPEKLEPLQAEYRR